MPKYQNYEINSYNSVYLSISMNELQVKQQLLCKLENSDYFIEWGSKVATIFNKRNKK